MITLVIEIDFEKEPSEYGGGPHMRILNAIEEVYPDAKKRITSRMSLREKDALDTIREQRNELAELCYNFATGKDDGSAIVKHVKEALEAV